jgi:hypothetical protein
MNRGRYNKTFLQIVDIIAAFFTDELVNNLYYKARNRAAENASTITDEYKRIVTQYAYGVTNKPEACKKVILSLHEYYSKVTRFTSITYVDFEDDLLTQFIPPEYYSDFTSKQKTATMGAIIINAVQSAIVYVHKPDILEQIIDYRNKSIGRPPTRVSDNDMDFTLSIQNHIVDVLMCKREEFYCDFAKKITEKSQKVSVDLHQKLRDELKNQVERRCAAERERDKALKIILQLVEKIKALNVQLANAATVKPTYVEHQQRLSDMSTPYGASKWAQNTVAGAQNAAREAPKWMQVTPQDTAAVPPMAAKLAQNAAKETLDERPVVIDGPKMPQNEPKSSPIEQPVTVKATSIADDDDDNIENYYNITIDDFVDE